MKTSPNNRWFEVDADGMRNVFARYKKSAALCELVANALDTGDATTVDVTLERGRGDRVTITVEDNSPDGFSDLMHSYTLFAPSSRGSNAGARGRFNLGCKYATSLCREATVESTRGTIRFDRSGRHASKKKRVSGTRYTGVMDMSDAEYNEAIADLQRLIVPQGVTMRLNGVEVAHREPLATVDATLDTEIASEEGRLTRTKRATKVAFYELQAGEEAWLFELGIPVCTLGGGTCNIDVAQKVPVSLDRTSVPRAFRQALRALALNQVHGSLSQAQATEAWVNEALSGKDVLPEAVESVLTARYGEKRVAYDPSDREANNRAVAAGYVVVHGGSLPAGGWAAAKSANALPAAGSVFPTNLGGGDRDRNTIPIGEWTESMRKLAGLSARIAKRILDVSLTVVFDVDLQGRDAANYSGAGSAHGRLCFNLGRLGKKWPDQGVTAEVLDLLVHELGHAREVNHLSDAYNNALTMIAGRLAIEVRNDPSILAWSEVGYDLLCSARDASTSLSMAARSR